VKEYHKLNNALYELQQHRRGMQALNQQGATEVELEMQPLMERKLCLDTVYGDPNFCEALLSYCRLTCVWLLRLARAPPQGLPLPPPSKVFAALPEHAVDGVAEAFLFVLQMNFGVLEGLMKNDLHDLVDFLLVMASSPSHVKNPYLRGKLIQIISYLVPQEDRYTRGGGSLTSLFIDHVACNAFLVPLIVQFWVDIEVTGSHTQFYDKFQYRHYMSQLLRYLWDLPAYRAALQRESETQSFVRFVNLLINDVTYCMDESLGKLQQINTLENDMPTWASKPEQERVQLEQQHRQAEKECKHFMQQTNQNINIVCYITSGIVAPFMAPELKDRIAAFLNYILVHIAGPKCLELKIREPEKVHFNPKQLLTQITEIYIHLATHPDFAMAVAKDGRSYNVDVFRRTAHILQREHLINPVQMTDFTTFIAATQECASQEADLTELLGDIPEEFTDPISCELIRDPVRLPSSKQIVDRSTIARHVLSDQNDPFNREFLDSEMVKQMKTDEELKARIDAWVNEQIAKAQTAPTDPMDAT